MDLARTAGVSTQQIRNYIAAAILPPADRAATGYRLLHDGHRHALLAYRALAAGHGWENARTVLQSVHAGDEQRALEIIDAVHATVHQQRGALDEMGAALEAVAGQETPEAAVPQAGLRIGEAAARLGVRTSALRVWESAGLLVPQRERGTGYRVYTAADVRDARMILMLRQSRYPLTQIRPILDGLRTSGSSAALREAIARRKAQLAQRSVAMLEGASRLHTYLTHRHATVGDDVVADVSAHKQP
ncbi:MerR family transcriptional regulator [Actinomycetes bacterium KLBMP 9759]